MLFVSWMSICSAFAFEWPSGHPSVEVGGFLSHTGRNQWVGINGSRGNDYTVNHTQQGNGLIGAGYYLDWKEQDLFDWCYGLNVFYLPKVSVSGEIFQERLFSNLAYQYSMTQLPIYVATKATLKKPLKNYLLTFDLGMGPNIIKTLNYQETVINTINLKDNALLGHQTVAFSAMLGIGIKRDHAIGDAPLECGYRFFYLGQGSLRKSNNQVLNDLKTGQGYANALLCSITL